LIAVLLFLLFGVFYFIGEPAVDIEENYDQDGIYYSEATMQEYANEKYLEFFTEEKTMENNLLLVFLTNEEADGYYTIAWVGDNIKREISLMFGEDTEYGEALFENINNEYYAYSLDSDLTAVIKDMENHITDRSFSTPFEDEQIFSGETISFVKNYSSLDLNEEKLNQALEDFSKQTGISCVLVIDSAEKVFGYEEEIITSEENLPEEEEIVVEGSVSFGTIGLFVALVLGIIIIICLAVFLRKKKTKKEEEKLPWEG
ncbi:MAG: hypothetical protein IJ262_10545, partial [Clostridia bacterium]|nr:hypothetical protein [Clostridia bacterium]